MSFPESDLQFLAKMVVAAREGHQISSREAQRLNNLAEFGDSLPRGDAAVGRTTMPEERREASQPFPSASGVHDVVRG
jgi:hypothetical protein